MTQHGRRVAAFALVALAVALAHGTARAAAPDSDDETFVTVYGGVAGLHPGEVGTVPVYHLHHLCRRRARAYPRVRTAGAHPRRRQRATALHDAGPRPRGADHVRAAGLRGVGLHRGARAPAGARRPRSVPGLHAAVPLHPGSGVRCSARHGARLAPAMSQGNGRATCLRPRLHPCDSPDAALVADACPSRCASC